MAGNTRSSNNKRKADSPPSLNPNTSKTMTAAEQEGSSSAAFALAEVIKGLQNQIDNLNVITSKHQEIIKKQTVQIKSLTTDNEAITNKVLSLENECLKLTNRVKILETNKPSFDKEIINKAVRDALPNPDPSTFTKIQEAITEQHERIRRSTNIIMMGIAEDDKCLSKCKEVLDLILPNNNIRVWNNRIGVKAEGKVRPIRIRLDSANHVQNAISNNNLIKCNKNLEGIYVRRDETKLQQFERKERHKQSTTTPHPANPTTLTPATTTIT